MNRGCRVRDIGRTGLRFNTFATTPPHQQRLEESKERNSLNLESFVFSSYRGEGGDAGVTPSRSWLIASDVDGPEFQVFFPSIDRTGQLWMVERCSLLSCSSSSMKSRTDRDQSQFFLLAEPCRSKLVSSPLLSLLRFLSLQGWKVS